ncbi:hypothetical protein [Arthrobacter monumenti]
MSDLLSSFILDPARYWGVNSRQLTKTERRKQRIKKYFGWSNEDLAQLVSGAAEWRVAGEQCTVYLPNFGSSGSHLVQQIIAACLPANPVGELYIPKRIVGEVKQLRLRERRLFIEGYNLLHTTSPEHLFSRSVIINTAHVATLKNYVDWSRKHRSLLIIRDPVDLVLSRTFRKQEYRDYLGNTNADDLDYLDHNINQTILFYEAALQKRYAHVLRFEDVLARPQVAAEVLFQLLENEGIRLDTLIQQVEHITRAGDSTKKYAGETIPIDESHAQLARNRLSSLRKDLGYK